ncbi:MAG: hypothetical protein GXY77_02450 [Fibrobacter sp.]|nr:hypothetical protein [Fibrobacter sp.]
MYKPQTRLKNEMRIFGITPHDVAMRLNRPYSTVQQWLNGYSKFPDHARNTIQQLINERKSGRENQYCNSQENAILTR